MSNSIGACWHQIGGEGGGGGGGGGGKDESDALLRASWLELWIVIRGCLYPSAWLEDVFILVHG